MSRVSRCKWCGDLSPIGQPSAALVPLFCDDICARLAKRDPNAQKRTVPISPDGRRENRSREAMEWDYHGWRQDDVWDG